MSGIRSSEEAHGAGRAPAAEAPESAPKRSVGGRSRRGKKGKKRPKERRPRYRRQRRDEFSDLAFVELNGLRFYLGPYGTNESKAEYERVLAEWEERGRQPPPDANSLTVLELIARFWAYAEGYYRRADGTPTGEALNHRRVLGVVKELYGHTPAAEFSPRCLKAVRKRLIDEGSSRTYTNKNIGRVKSVFRWATEEELVPPGVYQALSTVAGLKRGRTPGVRETKPVRPVAREHIDAIRPHVSRQVFAMIELQLLTAARPGEIVLVRAADIDRSGKVWRYTPESHKTAHHGFARSIYFGPKAQELLEPYLSNRKPTAYAFSPAEAETERRMRLSASRKTPLSCGNVPGSNRKEVPEREPQDHYTRDSYRRAIHRACNAAKIPQWSPHQLRHAAATELRRAYGLDAARAVLGHRTPVVTEIYAELDMLQAVRIAEERG